MIFNLIWVFSILIFCVASQFLPGVAPPDYADGSFSEPNARSTNLTVGEVIDVQWNATFTNANIFLITQFNFSVSQILADNVLGSNFQWTVSLARSETPNNASQIYVLRAADNNASEDEQATGGFLSSSFYINALPGSGSSSSSSSTSTSTTSTVSMTATSLSSPTQQTTSSASVSPASSHGLSAGASAGIGIGVALGAIGLAAVAWLAFNQRRRWQSQLQGTQSDAYYLHPTTQKSPIVEAPSNVPYDPQELPAFRD